MYPWLHSLRQNAQTSLNLLEWLDFKFPYLPCFQRRLFFNFLFYYLLGKGGYVFGSVGWLVCLFVCLSVDNITQKVMNGLG